MKTILFKIYILLFLASAINGHAQKSDKKYSERFIVKPTVTIDINTRYTDIEIETWDKNEVVIEAFMEIEGETDQKTIDEYFKKWRFEALGNKNKVTITSKTIGFININSFDFNSPNYDDIHLFGSLKHDVSDDYQFIIPEISVNSLGLLDSLDSKVIIADTIRFPGNLVEPMFVDFDDNFHNLYMIEKFDFKKYKNDKNYLKEWKERNKEALKDYDVKIGRNSISISTNKKNVSKYELKKRIEENQERIKEKRRHLQAQLKERQKKIRERLYEKKEERKLVLYNLKKQREVYAKRRAEVRDILEKREKIKVKRIIKIKAPKDAKFNMNVKYGSMRFPN